MESKVVRGRTPEVAGRYRVYYTTAELTEGFYSIGAVSEEDALEEAARLVKREYEGAHVTRAKLMREGS